MFVTAQTAVTKNMRHGVFIESDGSSVPLMSDIFNGFNTAQLV